MFPSAHLTKYNESNRSPETQLTTKPTYPLSHSIRHRNILLEIFKTLTFNENYVGLFFKFYPALYTT
jgi:hypothetical protein